MSTSLFSYTREELQTVSSKLLDIAKHKGATQCAVNVSEGVGQSISVRNGEVETIEYNQDKGFGVTVYIGQAKGSSSSSDFSDKALSDAVEGALAIARFTASDDCAGLADASRMASDFPDLDLFHPWDISVEDAIELARECEAAALAVSPLIQNTEGGSVSKSASQFIYANSHGFMHGESQSRHSISASVIAQNEQGMQRDYAYSSARLASNLKSAQEVGKLAGQRTIDRLGHKSLKTGQYPIIFDARVSGSLIGHLLGAIQGGSLYRKSSFLLDSAGTQVMNECVSLIEDPFVLRGFASCSFDDEGVATVKRKLVEKGILQGYLLGSYSARKLGLSSTGNAGGAHNITVPSTGETFAELLSDMGSGVLITQLMGQGVNGITGDYSRGASGFWVENGVITHPVEEITIAGNLKDMFKDIQAIALDHKPDSSIKVGSILIGSMQVAGDA